ncbi:MAG: bifunctional folylpolyglutamate synthase/dihydrofolate synthase [Terriglobia bacterium]
MNYAACINQLTELGQELRGVKFDLETTRSVLAALGNPHLKVSSVIVAGTNGKGSTCSMLAAILERAGLRIGLYTSPHLVRVNERIRVSGQDISDDDFAAAFTRVHQAAMELAGRGELVRHPSYFEYLTATAFLHFARVQVEIAVLEVGMGGRLDATNVTEPLVSVITNVALDHEQFLGGTLEAIAFEKAGVIRPGCPVVSGCEIEGPAEVIRRRCRELNSELLDLPRVAHVSNRRAHDGNFSFDLELDSSHYSALAPALAGGFQVKNAIAAVAAAQLLQRQGLPIPLRTIEEGLGRARWPGRLETIHRRPLVLLDGAHNPAAARELACFVREQLSGRCVRLVYASMRDKAIDEITEILFPLAHEVYLTRPAVTRAASPNEILKRARTQPERVMIDPDPPRAVEEAFQASEEEDVILVAGSLFLVGAILRAHRDGVLALERRPAGAVSVQPI